MRMLRLKSMEHYEGLKLNRWGIRELDPGEIEGMEDGEFWLRFRIFIDRDCVRLVGRHIVCTLADVELRS